MEEFPSIPCFSWMLDFINCFSSISWGDNVCFFVFYFFFFCYVVNDTNWFLTITLTWHYWNEINVDLSVCVCVCVCVCVSILWDIDSYLWFERQVYSFTHSELIKKLKSVSYIFISLVRVTVRLLSCLNPSKNSVVCVSFFSCKSFLKLFKGEKYTVTSHF